MTTYACAAPDCPNSTDGGRWCIEHMDRARAVRRVGLVGVLVGAGRAAEACREAARRAVEAADLAEGDGFPPGRSESAYSWPIAGTGTAPAIADAAIRTLADADRPAVLDDARRACRSGADLATHREHRRAAEQLGAAADHYSAGREAILRLIEADEAGD